MFKNTFSFEGRIRRTEYGITFIICFTTIVMINFIADTFTTGAAWLLIALYIPAAWFLLAQGTKRCHDVGKSGWWQLVPFYAFFLLLQEGDKTVNKFGISPRPAVFSSSYEFGAADASSFSPDTSGYKFPTSSTQPYNPNVEEYETV